MARNWIKGVLTAVFAMGLTGAAIAQSPAPEAAASAAPSNVDVNINRTETTPPPADTKTDVNINKTETVETAPSAPVSSTSTTVWGFDGKTVLIGGALLLGIILIAVAAAGRDDRTTVVR